MQVPRASLALATAPPQPSRAGVLVSIAIPDAAPARLELFDVLGRRLRSREVGELGAGDHVTSLAEPGALRPGIYLVRLTRDGRELWIRTAVLH